MLSSSPSLGCGMCPTDSTAFLKETLDTLVPDSAAYQRLVDSIQYWHDKEKEIADVRASQALFDDTVKVDALVLWGRVDMLNTISRIMKSRQTTR